MIKEIYTDANGITWSSFENWSDIPAKRVIPADLSVRRASWGLSPERMVDAFKEIKDDLNKGDIVSGFSKFDQLERRVQDLPDELLLQDLACVFVLHPEEDGNQYDLSMQRRKIELWREDENARFFFTILGARHIMNLSDISDDYIHTLILQRSLMELTEGKESIFPLVETGLTNLA